MMASDRVDFEGIYLGGKSYLREGKLRLAPNGIGWKETKSGSMVTIAAGEMKRCQWLRAAKDFELRIVGKGGVVYKFDGFPADANVGLKQTLKSFYSLDLEQKELGVRGWNWGQTEFQGNSLFFHVANKPVMEVPLNEVSNTAMTTKTEVSLEFRLPTAEQIVEEKELGKGDQLVEMRFFLPITGKDSANAATDEEPELDADGNPIEKEVSADLEDEASAAQQFYETIKTKASLGMVAGEAIVPFHELPFVTPRGRYEVEMFDDFLRMHGKTYDYKILYKSIKSMFVVPKPDDIHVFVVIGLDPPIRQGQTRYPFLVVQFLRDEDIEISLTMEEEELRGKFGGRLKKEYDAPTYEVVTSIFHAMTGVPLTTPETLRSHYGQAGIKCSLKVNEGLLYPLEDALLFLPKPATHMAYAEIATIVFSRVGSSVSASRTFDMKVVMKKGGDFAFSGLNKEEHSNLESFLKLKKLRVKTEIPAEEQMAQMDVTSSEDEESDGEPRKKRARSSQEASGAAAASAGGDDDDSDEDDEDYVAGDSDDDVPEEFDENYESSGSSGSDEGGSDDEDDEEDDS